MLQKLLDSISVDEKFLQFLNTEPKLENFDLYISSLSKNLEKKHLLKNLFSGKCFVFQNMEFIRRQQFVSDTVYSFKTYDFMTNAYKQGMFCNERMPICEIIKSFLSEGNVKTIHLQQSVITAIFEVCDDNFIGVLLSQKREPELTKTFAQEIVILQVSKQLLEYSLEINSFEARDIIMHNAEIQKKFNEVVKSLINVDLKVTYKEISTRVSTLSEMFKKILLDKEKNRSKSFSEQIIKGNQWTNQLI
jgi:hypothetical protein